MRPVKHETITARNLKKIQDRLTAGIQGWDSTHNLTLEYTRFEVAHGLDRDFNGDSLGMTLRTDLYTVKDLNIFRFDSKYEGFDLYATLVTHPGVSTYERTYQEAILVRFRDLKGRNKDFVVPRYLRDIDNKKSFLNDLSYKLNRALDLSDSSLNKPAEYHEKGMSLDEEDRISKLWAVYETAKLKPYEDLVDKLQYGSNSKVDELTELFASKGLTLLTVLHFNFHLSIFPDFVRESTNSVEIGKNTNGTYSSHPEIFKLTRGVKGPTMVKLEDIGAERSGYYQHSRKFSVRAEEVDAVKKFVSRFNRGYYNIDLIKSAARAK